MSEQKSHTAFAAVTLGLALSFTSVANAQDWITPKVCTITPADISLASERLDEPATATELDALAAKIPNGIGRLWEIKSPDGAVSHLWGTMHSSESAILDLPPTMLNLLNASQRLALEMDYRHKDRASLESALAFEGWWQDTFLPPKAMPMLAGADPRIKGWIQERIIATGVDYTYASYLSPGGVVGVLLSDPCEDFTAGTLPIQDSFIQTLAHIQNIPITGLEPPMDVMMTLNDPANEVYAEALITTYGAYLLPQTDNSERATYVAMYLRGQLGAMQVADEIYLSEMLGPHAETGIELTNMYLLVDRNISWIDAAQQDLENGGLFIAVGAAHLPGAQGLVALLRKEGFSVRRIPVEGEDDQRY